jgi:hypothetical protein
MSLIVKVARYCCYTVTNFLKKSQYGFWTEFHIILEGIVHYLINRDIVVCDQLL